MSLTLDEDAKFIRDLCSFDFRLKTFSCWPFDNKCNCTADRMAHSGFFHPKNGSEDLAQCFVCFKELDGWEPDMPFIIFMFPTVVGRSFERYLRSYMKYLIDQLLTTSMHIYYADDPEKEHKSHSPNCPFLTSKPYEEMTAREGLHMDIIRYANYLHWHKEKSVETTELMMKEKLAAIRTVLGGRFTRARRVGRNDQTVQSIAASELSTCSLRSVRSTRSKRGNPG
ncbi:inhibitor of Apoptosis domain protein [Opisthorchis viverrini]|uniref:Inhibitor of Apoptosis domain protein n=1 Tax=Opisthorchis viverrini TaxID=6198 RepID=A0A1S8WS97_OPIVI|nr:inhibitor of Apoptosis domain protein [Opisthorchis viverrini]